MPEKAKPQLEVNYKRLILVTSAWSYIISSPICIIYFGISDNSNFKWCSTIWNIQIMNFSKWLQNLNENLPHTATLASPSFSGVKTPPQYLLNKLLAFWDPWAQAPEDPKNYKRNLASGYILSNMLKILTSYFNVI